MRLKVNMSVVGLCLKENEGKEGRKFYQISIDQDGEAGTLPITEEVYNNSKSTFKRYAPCTLTCEYNDQFKNFRVVGLSQGITKV